MLMLIFIILFLFLMGSFMKHLGEGIRMLSVLIVWICQGLYYVSIWVYNTVIFLAKRLWTEFSIVALWGEQLSKKVKIKRG